MSEYKVVLSRRYIRSFKRVKRHKDFDAFTLEKVVRLLAHDELLPPHFHDHALKGDYTGYRECHIKNDILLVYQKQNDILVLLLVDIGSHSSLFE